MSGIFSVGPPPAAEPGLLVYIMVADAGAALTAVQAAGGQVIRPIDPNGAEIFAWFKDPSGNVLGVYQQPGLAEAEKTEAGEADAVDLGRMMDLATPWCLYVAATLRIGEHIAAGRTGEVGHKGRPHGLYTAAIRNKLLILFNF